MFPWKYNTKTFKHLDLKYYKEEDNWSIGYFVILKRVINVFLGKKCFFKNHHGILHEKGHSFISGKTVIRKFWIYTDYQDNVNTSTKAR